MPAFQHAPPAAEDGLGGNDEGRDVGVVDDLVLHLEKVDHVAAHDLSLPLLIETLEVVDQVSPKFPLLC